MLSSETLVFTRARNTFSPMLSTSAMHRPRLSRRSNAAFRSLSSGSTATLGWGRAVAAEEVEEEEASLSACCLLADRRFARDIQRIRSATHHMRSDDGLVVMMWCLGVADGVVNLAGEGIQQGVAATSTRAVAAAMERDDTPEKTAAEAEATAAVASAMAAARAVPSAGRPAGGGGGGLAATARAEEAIRGRSRPDRRSARAADARRAGPRAAARRGPRPGARRARRAPP
ncbi:hypothetical protein EE612_012918 [Oryza sativa]|nr:hypothetical protein EE612_012918 [Oryza sativa]